MHDLVNAAVFVLRQLYAIALHLKRSLGRFFYQYPDQILVAQVGVTGQHASVLPVPHLLDDVLRNARVEGVAGHRVAECVERDSILSTAPFDACGLHSGPHRRDD